MSDPSSKTAGGWGALKATMKMVWHERNAVACSKALLKVNQPDGFDCPGCAWPERDHTLTFEFCENGAKAVAAETTSKRADSAFFARHSVTELAAHDDFWLEDQGRLTEPMCYNPHTDHYEPIAWQAAFDLIAETLHGLDSPDEAVFYTSGRTSNEAAFLYQLFARLLGTNNLPDCSNMCHESSGDALGETIGIGKGTVSIEDFEVADTIFIMGQNPGTNHPRMLATLEAAAHRGARIVTLNPLVEPGLVKFLHPQHAMDMLTNHASSLSTHYYQPLIGGDLAALKGIIKWLFLAEDEAPGAVFDHAFIREHTVGVDELRKDAESADWAEIELQSGLNRAQLKEIADIYREAESAIICWAMGLTQHKHAVATIQYVTNLLFLRGNIGRPGAGACPVRGHSNVQGDRTVGITERPAQRFLDRLGEVFEFEPPREHGYDVVAAIEAMVGGKAKVFFGMGGNFARATPDRSVTEQALRRCKLTAHVTTKLNRSHLIHGEAALILPCLGRTEQDLQDGGFQSITVEDSMGVVHASVGTLTPASEQLYSEPAIVAGMGKSTFPDAAVDWEGMTANYALIRDKIEAVLPDLFGGFNENIRHPGGFRLYNSAAERSWHTPTGKATFKVHPIPDLSLPKGQFRLMTIRSHDQYNTTLYGMDDRYRGVHGDRDIVFLNEEDMAEQGLLPDDRVDIVSHWHDGRDRIMRQVRVVPFDLPRTCAAAYFPEANVLVPLDSIADKSRTPTSKYIPVSLRRA